MNESVYKINLNYSRNLIRIRKERIPSVCYTTCVPRNDRATDFKRLKWSMALDYTKTDEDNIIL